MTLVLASGSAVRRRMLDAAGVRFDVQPADIDEPRLAAALLDEGAAPGGVAEGLSKSKAFHVAARRPGSFVLGSDQVLVMDGTLYGKPGTMAEARERLIALRGRSHTLISGAALARHDGTLWCEIRQAHLTMRSFTDAFLDDYLDQIGDAALASTGAYFLEGLGAQLFEQIEGDYFTVLGMPLLPVLNALREHGVLES